MTMISDALILVAISASGGLIGYIIGSWSGWQRGRDEQWVESFIERNNRERERRDKTGRFKTKTK